ncbi:AraC family transcriptional regulator [Bacillus sp. ISL-46]|uniref:AraC family transcriptional regulator n=1 Tax=Bacillus sp. ISL-46 TaxID=2819129 RepID=UPI001BE8F94A|nr:AraC family transcriptional regulator [Bacillus sp. ISL-46]MBT2723206.1 AraC family transcriptional regulator ligand-binding domain-containing protein [Bacillus sp. ISL-46]
MTAHSLDRIKIPVATWAGFHQLGISAQDVVRKAQLPLTILTESVEVTTAQYFAIWSAVSELMSDAAVGIIKFIAELNPAQLPPSVLAPYHARDYRDALSRIARYKQLCFPERLHITEDGELCTIELEFLYTEQPEPPILVYLTFASLLQLGRIGSGHRFPAKSVEFSHPNPLGDVRALEDYFGIGVKFGATNNRLILHRSDLDRHFVTYNAELLDILVPALEKSLDDKQRSKSTTEIVKWIIKRSLDGGRPDVQIIAGELGMSERTLQRRLTDEGTSFKHLLSEARREKARKYLADPSLDIKEVAFLLGYEDKISFYRAFRLWEGDTPSNWRAEQLGIREGSQDMPLIH